MYKISQSAKCPTCGVEFVPTSTRISGDLVEVVCPNGHRFTAPVEIFEVLLDCEIRDWDRFSLLPQQTQQLIIEVIQSGKVPHDAVPLMRRLREAGVVVCT